MLHHVSCHHIGDNNWEPEDYDKTLTRKPKRCSTDYKELEGWVTAHGFTVTDCPDCRRVLR